MHTEEIAGDSSKISLLVGGSYIGRGVKIKTDDETTPVCHHSGRNQQAVVFPDHGTIACPFNTSVFFITGLGTVNQGRSTPSRSTARQPLLVCQA